jgi:hypothetical protein
MDIVEANTDLAHNKVRQYYLFVAAPAAGVMCRTAEAS